MPNNSSEVKIYIPKDKNGKSLVKTGKHWYVYCYFDNKKTGKRDYKYIIKGNINRLKTYRDRKERANIIKSGLILAIKDGWTPFENTSTVFDHININCIDALEKAKGIKKLIWSKKTSSSMVSHSDLFIKYIKDCNIDHKNISSLNKRIVTSFLNKLTKDGKSPKTRNNYKATISSLFSQMVVDGYIDRNIILDIPNLKTNPKKNIPFNNKELKEISQYLIKNDILLYNYIQFIGYAFLRPIEVNRIKLKDIDISKKIVRIKTKTGYQTIYLINKLIDIIKYYKIDNLESEFTLFTPDNKPCIWTTEDKNKQSYFNKRRFKKVKDHFNLNADYSLYSFRHSFILNLYHNFIKSMTQLQAKHKLMTITRHKSLSGLENYLRDIGAILPDDFSDEFTIDF